MPWPFKKANRFPVFSKIPGRDLFDLHAHVLPGLDDGASDFEEAIAMLDGLAALGYSCVASTPHFDSETLKPDKSEQEGLIAELASRRQGRPPSVITGAEVVYDDLFLEEEEKGNVPRIGDNHLYVVEFNFNHGSVPPTAEESFFRFQVKGGSLILAHPERIPDFQKDIARIKSMRKAGALLQIDLLSLAGKYGDLAKRTAFDLIEDRAADIVSSDLHCSADLEVLDEALDLLAKWNFGELVRLASINPKLLLDGRPEEVRRNA